MKSKTTLTGEMQAMAKMKAMENLHDSSYILIRGKLIQEGFNQDKIEAAILIVFKDLMNGIRPKTNISDIQEMIDEPYKVTLIKRIKNEILGESTQ